MLAHAPLYMQIGLWCYFSGGGLAKLTDGAHRPAKTPLFSPTYTLEHSCRHNAGAASGEPWPYLHVDGEYCAPTSSTMTSSGGYQHAEFLGLKEAAVATIFSGLGGTALTMLAHVPLCMQRSAAQVLEDWSHRNSRRFTNDRVAAYEVSLPSLVASPILRDRR
ncbi:hypothetical protein HPB50_022167 [Hyalomma asiaticum]|uniref:Uncharacterized protein n=1 Tax=Hyalomma asiaticum TaxID=266040 RepID=A0ACB7S0V7_HYAAI|nr:hypothetical protein HPB50_022167 [Hyalomma asiaticum]